MWTSHSRGTVRLPVRVHAALNSSVCGESAHHAQLAPRDPALVGLPLGVLPSSVSLDDVGCGARHAEGGEAAGRGQVLVTTAQQSRRPREQWWHVQVCLEEDGGKPLRWRRWGRWDEAVHRREHKQTLSRLTLAVLYLCKTRYGSDKSTQVTLQHYCFTLCLAILVDGFVHHTVQCHELNIQVVICTVGSSTTII